MLVSILWKPSKILLFLWAQFSNEGNTTVLPSCEFDWATGHKYTLMCRDIIQNIDHFRFLYLPPALMTDESTPSLDPSQSPSQCRVKLPTHLLLNKSFWFKQNIRLAAGQISLHHLTPSFTPGWTSSKMDCRSFSIPIMYLFV